MFRKWIAELTSKLKMKYVSHFGIEPIFGVIPLSPEIIGKKVDERLKKYRGLNFFERYAMYMGVTQLLEFGLKKLLTELYDVELEQIENISLGQTCGQLKQRGLRGDFILLLEVEII